MPAQAFLRDIHFGPHAWIRVTSPEKSQLDFTPMWNEPLPSIGWRTHESGYVRSMLSSSDFTIDMAQTLLYKIPRTVFGDSPEIFAREREARLMSWARLLWSDFAENCAYLRQVSLGTNAQITFTRNTLKKGGITVRAYVNENRVFASSHDTDMLSLKDAKEIYETIEAERAMTDSYFKAHHIEALKLIRTESALAHNAFFAPVQIEMDLDEDDYSLAESTLAKLRNPIIEPIKELRVYKRSYTESHWIVDTEITHQYEFIGIFEVVGDGATLVSGTITLPDGSKIKANPGYGATTHSLQSGNWMGWDRIV